MGLEQARPMSVSLTYQVPGTRYHAARRVEFQPFNRSYSQLCSCARVHFVIGLIEKQYQLVGCFVFSPPIARRNERSPTSIERWKRICRPTRTNASELRTGKLRCSCWWPSNTMRTTTTSPPKRIRHELHEVLNYGVFFKTAVMWHTVAQELSSRSAVIFLYAPYPP